MFCLDTNIWSYLLRTPNEVLVRKINACRTPDICLTDLIRGELLFGAKRSSHAEFLTSRIEDLLAPYSILPFDRIAAEHYADIRMNFEKSGNLLSPNDLIIAATVRAANATLITANFREFSRIPGLRCEDWTTA
jgi:tRNA(fMet)-specific endonuclease VapC